eukprot:TRINITY_DN301_c0_g1_i1.p1 TRINITY_DN301_c0_g1~~TRINITY_DN301_c0_g1_i1.p1  ORF type:complete len:202 (+),score=53.18 TRINITY_DN301_c0_g1_i1:39-608(+)
MSLPPLTNTPFTRPYANPLSPNECTYNKCHEPIYTDGTLVNPYALCHKHQNDQNARVRENTELSSMPGILYPPWSPVIEKRLRAARRSQMQLTTEEHLLAYYTQFCTARNLALFKNARGLSMTVEEQELIDERAEKMEKNKEGSLAPSVLSTDPNSAAANAKKKKRARDEPEAEAEVDPRPTKVPKNVA